MQGLPAKTDMEVGEGISDLEFAKFQRLIHDIAGIALSDSKKNLLLGRLAKRLHHLGLSTYSQYLKLLGANGDPDERQLMVDLLTTNETYFFREEEHFEFLRGTASAHSPDRPFAVWSAACSTGEEVYTIAMVLADTLGIDASWNVTGSDISLSVLRTAESGHYPMERTRGLPQEYLRKYCLKGIGHQAGTFLIDRRLRQHASFLQANLNAPLPNIGSFDVIFLRNVMIYFDPETKRRVVEKVVSRLLPGGHLLIGHSETLNGVAENLEQLRPTIYRKPLPSHSNKRT